MSKELPKEIRDELRVTAAMRCYSVMRSGGSKSTSAQHDYMFSLFHGDGSSIPANVDMLCNGSYVYRELYDVNAMEEPVLSKSDDADAESRISLSLKSSLIRNKSRTYYAKIDICKSDLEKKGRNGKQLVSGRNLLDMAKKGTANYRKALSFAVKKFDLEKMDVIESGNSIDDVIEYVRCEMYKLLTKDDVIKKKTIVLDGDDELDDSKDLEDEYLSEIKNTSSNESSKKKASNKVSNKAESVINNNEKNDGNSSSSVATKKSDEEQQNDSSNEDIDCKLIPPKDWYFQSWFSFLMYGPFVSKDKRLALLEITDAAKNVGKSRNEKRKAGKLEKDAKRVADNVADRGFSTDQKLQLELIGLSRISTTDRSRESRLMGLCVQEQALTKQIDRAEKIAEKLAPNDMENMNNKWWKKVYTLIQQQEEIVLKMASLNDSAIDESNGGSKYNQGSNLANSTLTNKSDDSILTTNQK